MNALEKMRALDGLNTSAGGVMRKIKKGKKKFLAWLSGPAYGGKVQATIQVERRPLWFLTGPWTEDREAAEREAEEIAAGLGWELEWLEVEKGDA